MSPSQKIMWAILLRVKNEEVLTESSGPEVEARWEALQAIPWVEEAYVVEIVEAEQVTLQRAFHLPGTPAPKLPGVPVRPSVEDLVKLSHETAKAKGWHDGLDPTNTQVQLAWLALLHSEVSEAVEDVREGKLTETFREEDGKPMGLPSELADIAIRLFDTAGALGIDLEGAILRKMAHNAGRSHRHGGKLA